MHNRRARGSPSAYGASNFSSRFISTRPEDVDRFVRGQRKLKPHRFARTQRKHTYDNVSRFAKNSRSVFYLVWFFVLSRQLRRHETPAVRRVTKYQTDLTNHVLFTPDARVIYASSSSSSSFVLYIYVYFLFWRFIYVSKRNLMRNIIIRQSHTT